YHRPSIVIGFEANGIGKASGRSIEGFNLVEALNRCAGSLEKFGGHEMAAGLTIRQEKIDVFAAKFRRIARELLSDECLQRCLRRRRGISHSGFERMNTKAKPGWACRFRRCEKLLQSTNGNLATARRAGLDPATAFTCAAPTPDRDSRRFTDSFPAASRRST